MHHVVHVRIGQRRGHLGHDGQHLVLRQQMALLAPGLQGLAFDVFHRDVGQLANLAAVVDLHDVGVLQPRGGFGLAEKAGAGVVERGAVELLAQAQGLDGDMLAGLIVVRQVNHTHGAARQFALQTVALTQQLRQWRCGRCHGCGWRNLHWRREGRGRSGLGRGGDCRSTTLRGVQRRIAGWHGQRLADAAQQQGHQRQGQQAGGHGQWQRRAGQQQREFGAQQQQHAGAQAQRGWQQGDACAQHQQNQRGHKCCSADPGCPGCALQHPRFQHAGNGLRQRLGLGCRVAGGQQHDATCQRQLVGCGAVRHGQQVRGAQRRKHGLTIARAGLARPQQGVSVGRQAQRPELHGVAGLGVQIVEVQIQTAQHGQQRHRGERALLVAQQQRFAAQHAIGVGPVAELTNAPGRLAKHGLGPVSAAGWQTVAALRFQAAA